MGMLFQMLYTNENEYDYCVTVSEAQKKSVYRVQNFRLQNRFFGLANFCGFSITFQKAT